MQNQKAALSRSEELVMAALWQLPQPARRADIQKQLRSRAAWADSTLLNFLYRLEKKGYVRSEKEIGRAHV